MARNFIILSLGQLTKSDPMKSVYAFTALSVEQSKLPHFIAYPLYFLRTLAIYGWDIYFGKNIENYKLGNKTTNDFLGFLRSKFGGTNEQLKAAWNAMCVIDEQSKADIEHLLNLQANGIATQFQGMDADGKTYNIKHHIAPVIIGATNQLHADYFTDFCSIALKKSTNDIIFKFSYFSQCKTLDLTALANLALNAEKVDGDKVISLHSKVNIQGAIMSEFNPQKERLADKVQELVKNNKLSTSR